MLTVHILVGFLSEMSDDGLNGVERKDIRAVTLIGDKFPVLLL